MVTIKITLGSKKLKEDLGIFRDFRIINGSPFRTVSGEDPEEIKRLNGHFLRLVHKRLPSKKEKRRLERLICMAWKQYISLYEEGLFLQRRIKRFRCTVSDEYDNFGIDSRALYIGVEDGDIYPIYLS